VRLYIHAVMPNTDNLQAFEGFTIENQVPSDMILAVPCTNIVTGASPVRLARQQMKTRIQPGKIDVPLLTSLGRLRVSANGAQIRLSAFRKAKAGH
jgi:hypothetical protein